MTQILDSAELAALLGVPDSDVTIAGHGIPCVDVPASRWCETLVRCRDELGANFFDWLSAVDEPAQQAVDVLVHLVRCAYVTGAGPESEPDAALAKILVRTRLPAENPQLASIAGIWRGAAWHERETHEMFGVNFTDFADGSGLGLRPLLLPDGFSGNPLKKSFQLAARASKPWPGAKEPGEGAEGAPSRRKMLPPGVPDPAWGPRKPPEAVADPGLGTGPEGQLDLSGQASHESGPGPRRLGMPDG